ncbi:ATP-dependent Clp protease proteolytic subunit [Pseudomonas sp. GCEP-101]|uniref:ATP-dependent Clp protease proteolytic subunit n=1 Tax=Pseudomonas sp. GCEP-101 TaxID=2974552 RepID=UPI00223A735D|nr:ATP-dependent Clp protease proteolytic subunit [Pseudomonas sp. GCEP-101]
MARHIIHFTGPINSSTCGNLIGTCTKALQQGASHLQLNIATMGGDCAYGFTLYNYLLALPIPVDTHNLGTVESMGNILFLAGARRTACPLSKFLFHPFHWTLHGSVDHTRMVEYAASLQHDLALYEDIVRQRTLDAPQRLDVRHALTAEAHIVEPRQALAFGLIHGIDDVPIPLDGCQWSVHS